MAYAGDSIVAIGAGLMATKVEGIRGVTGPFELSAAVLLLGGLATCFAWGENKAMANNNNNNNNNNNKAPTIREAISVVRSDEKIVLVGLVQALFEAAMYIFVLQWPPIIAKVVGQAFG